MNQTIEAIYENGVFKPLKPNLVKLENRKQVTIVINSEDSAKESDLSLTEKYFKGLSEDDIEKVITHALDQKKV